MHTGKRSGNSKAKRKVDPPAEFGVGDIVAVSKGMDGIGIVEHIHDGGPGHSTDLVVRYFDDTNGSTYRNCLCATTDDSEVLITAADLIAMIQRAQKAGRE
jgi:hypothetical protein